MSSQTADTTPRRRLNIDLKADDEIPREEVEAARRRIEKLERYLKEPPPGALRVTLRRVHSGHDLAQRPYIADADMRVEGRVIASHVAGATAEDAADQLVERLRRQLRRVVGAEVAMRNEPRAIKAALESLDHRREYRPQKRLKPPEERRIVEEHRKYPSTPRTTLEAIHALLDGDLEFHIFRHAETDEDVVVYRRDDGMIGLIHPPGSRLAKDTGSAYVLPEPSRYPGPIKLEDARADMDELNLRFLYFIDLEDGRGKVLHLRHDGDYGLVEPD